MSFKKSQRVALGLALVVILLSGAGVFIWQRKLAAIAGAVHSGLDEPAAATESDNATSAAVQLTPQEQQQIGLQTVDVRRESLTDEVSAVGRVEEPESAISTVSSRYGGRVDRLFTNFIGQPVQKGDPIALITITGQPIQKNEPFSSTYSPGMIAAVEEYKFAVENQQHAHASARPDAAAQADALVEASRTRLNRWGLTPDQIDNVLASPQKPMQITVNAAAGGIVRSRKVTEGQYVNPGDPLIELTDLSTVWVKADVFDADIGRIQPGLSAEIHSEALPSLKLRGDVTFIETHADPQTRTTPVRIQVENPGIRLKPGMVVRTSFQIPLGNTLIVPETAVIDTGSDKIVYLVHDNGIFERRIVHVGMPLKDRYPVIDGLKSGDRVVTNGAFLIDSQTRLTGGMAGMFGGSRSFTESAAANDYKTAFRIDPDPPVGGKDHTIHVAVVDPAGKPVTDAQVRLTFIMPAMPAMGMPEIRNSAELKWDGKEFSGPFHISEAGSWNVLVEARRGNQSISVFRTSLNVR